MELPVDKQVLFGLYVFVALTYIPGMRVWMWVNLLHYIQPVCLFSAGSPKMYGHMVKTRRKQLSEAKDGKKKDSKDAKKAK